jgi:putative peptidoglycan lipid II flippase
MLLPPLAERAARDDLAGVATLATRTLRIVLAIAAPLAALAIALAEPAIRLLLERGAFTAESTRATAMAVAWYAPGILGMAGVHVLIRLYQALQEIRRMAAIGIAVIALNLVLMPTFTGLLGYRGLPLAASVNGIVLFVAMLHGIGSRLPAVADARIVRTGGSVTVAGLAALAAATAASAPWPDGVGGDCARVGLGALAGLAAYAVVLRAIGGDLLATTIDVVAPAVARRVSPGRA